MEHIFLPSTIEFLSTDRPNVGQLIITPCHQGYGTTLGNALRRVLLSSLPGAAVESVKIAGVQHEFSVIEGVEEDTIDIILNVKQIAVKLYGDGPVTVHLSKKGVGPVTAGDIEKNSEVEIINKDLVLAHITDSSKVVEMDIVVGKGRGYIPVSERDTKQLDLGTIAIDSLYTPIRDIGYAVELTRVGDVTDYEKLTVTIETNGTITPRDAVHQATKILIDHFDLILQSTNNTENVSVAETSAAVDVDSAEEVAKPAKKARKKKNDE
jgi:DNA-directed RNA polymerase subunit alpha